MKFDKGLNALKRRDSDRIRSVIFKFILCVVLLTVGEAWAVEPQRSLAVVDCSECNVARTAAGEVSRFTLQVSEIAKKSLPECVGLKPSEIALGTVCRTTEGAVATRVGAPHAGWRMRQGDESVTWFDGAAFGVTREQALQFCESRGMRLPSETEFQSLQKQFERGKLSPGLGLSHYVRREYMVLFGYVAPEIPANRPSSAFFWSSESPSKDGKVTQHGGPAIGLSRGSAESSHPVAIMNSAARCVAKEK